eukprot:TRINITY_DN1638_c0_g1_i1.p1 TRINITY_DN1638_c0_g1~~TRINITY_DN1638_c0_g1_i1.p1  ORF type:complete len:112 (-),score=17.10 TRINITY_DN1638_c0_g1_i1:34-369(-)
MIWMVQLFNREKESLRHLLYWDLQVGQDRGHHFHSREQWWYVISGEMLLAVEDVETKQREVFTMKTGMRVTIGGKIAHAVRGIEKCQVIESNGNEVYDSNDTFPYHVSFEK